MSKKLRFRTPFDSQHAKGAQVLLKDALQHFYHIYSLLCGKLRWNMSPLVTSEFSGLFYNTLTMTSILFVKVKNCRSQFKLSKKEKVFFDFFAQLLISTSNFEYFEKKMNLIAHVLLKLRIVKDMVR